MQDLTDLRIFLASLLKPIIDEAVSESLQSKSNLQEAPLSVEELPDFIKIKEAETITGFKRGYLYELVSKRAIPFHKVGASLRFSRKEIHQWIKAGRPHLMQQAVEQLASNYVVNKGNRK